MQRPAGERQGKSALHADTEAVLWALQPITLASAAAQPVPGTHKLGCGMFVLLAWSHLLVTDFPSLKQHLRVSIALHGAFVLEFA